MMTQHDFYGRYSHKLKLGKYKLHNLLNKLRQFYNKWFRNKPIIQVSPKNPLDKVDRSVMTITRIVPNQPR